MEIARGRCLSRAAQAAKQQLTSKPPQRGYKHFLSVPCRALSSTAKLPVTPRDRPISSMRSRHGAFTAPSHTTKRGASSFKGTYVAYGVAKKLFAACAEQADYTISEDLKKAGNIPKTPSGEDIGEGSGWWHKELGLLPTFSSWSQVTFLHMYLITVRLRGLSSPESVQTYNRYLFEHFSHEAERRMDVLHGITSRSIRISYLKDLFVQWRGVLAAYDEGLVKGDAQLGAAVWRNLFKGLPTDHNGNELDWAKVANVVLYMRRSLDKMSTMNEMDVLTQFARGTGAEAFFDTAGGVSIDPESHDMELPGIGLRVLKGGESKQRI
ncbi:Serine carboxypeptidase 3 [Microsporum audouinii]